MVAFTRWWEGKSKFVERISSAMVCTLLGMALANTGVIPHAGVVHDAVFDYAVPYAIVLVLLSSDLKQLVRAGRPMVVAFVVASVASFFGGLAAVFFLGARVGPEASNLGGVFTATFAGGSMNFVAGGEGLDIDASTFAAAAVVDNLSTVPYLMLQVWSAGVLGAFFLRRSGPDSGPVAMDEGEDPEALRRVWTHADVNIRDLSFLVGLPLAVLWVAGKLGAVVPNFPEVLWITTIALILAQVPWIRKVRGTEMVSYFVLHVFFLIIGAVAVIADVLDAGLPILLFMLTVIGVHALITYAAGWLLRIDLPTVSLASQAAIGGPGSALALGMAMKWHRLVMPAIIVGIFGYALGNYLGFAAAYLAAGWL